jgi:AcrR family transcriptional regulator
VDNDLQRAAAANAEAVLRRFFTADGRLNSLPAKQSRKLAVYDLIVQRFIPGVRYTELEVNRELMAVYDDYVTLRRGLIDFGLMDRANGQYWRSGGTVPIGTSRPQKPREIESGRVESPTPSSLTPSSQTRGSPGLSSPTSSSPTSSSPGPGSPRTGSLVRTGPSARGAARREAILSAAARLIAERGYAAVGMDDIGAAAGVTGPAIYRHFGAKASVLTAVFDRVIDAVTIDPDLIEPDPTGEPPEVAKDDPTVQLRHLVRKYAAAVSGRRRLMAVFIREVHHLPAEDRELLDERQRALIGRWRILLAQAHPDWDGERVRTAIHAAFGMLNAVGTFESPLSDRELATQLSDLTCAALQIEPSTSTSS